MSETQDPSLSHAKPASAGVVESSQSELFGATSVHYELSLESRQAVEAVEAVDRETALFHRVLEAMMQIDAVDKAVKAKAPCTGSVLSRRLNDVNREHQFGIERNSLLHGKIMDRLRVHFNSVGVEITPASSGGRRSGQNDVASELKARLKASHNIDIHTVADTSLESDEPVSGSRRLSHAFLEESLESSGLPPHDKNYARTILTRALLTLKVFETGVLYRGIGVVMGRILAKNRPPRETCLKGDAMRGVLIHMVEYLCAREGIAVIGDHNAVCPPVTELSIVLPEHVDDQVDAYASDDDGPDDWSSDELSDGYEDVDFEEAGIHPENPTNALPGSEEKVLMLAARYAAGMPLWNPEDRTDHGPRNRPRADSDSSDAMFEQEARRRADENYAYELTAAKTRSAAARATAKSDASSEASSEPQKTLPDESGTEEDDDDID